MQLYKSIFKFQEQIKQYEIYPISDEIKYQILRHIDQLKYYLSDELNISLDEIKNMQLDLKFKFSEALFIVPMNLFTACIIYGRYVPYFIVKNKREYIFSDDCKIFFDDEQEKWIYSKPSFDLGEIINYGRNK